MSEALRDTPSFVIPWRQGQSPSAVEERGTHRPVALCQLPAAPTSYEGAMHTIRDDLVLSFLCVGKGIVPASV